MEGRIKILLISLLISFSISQEYKIQFSHIPIGQGVGLSDSILVSNNAERARVSEKIPGNITILSGKKL